MMSIFTTCLVRYANEWGGDGFSMAADVVSCDRIGPEAPPHPAGGGVKARWVE